MMRYADILPLITLITSTIIISTATKTLVNEMKEKMWEVDFTLLTYCFAVCNAGSFFKFCAFWKLFYADFCMVLWAEICMITHLSLCDTHVMKSWFIVFCTQKPTWNTSVNKMICQQTVWNISSKKSLIISVVVFCEKKNQKKNYLKQINQKSC